MPLITERFVKEISSSPPGWYWDERLPGFALRALGPGRASYYVKYRTRESKQVKHCIGSTAILSATVARKRAEELLASARIGRDLVGEMRDRAKKERALHTIADLYNHHRIVHAPPTITHSSYRMYGSLWRNHILPAIGDAYVEKLTQADMRKFLANVHQPAAKRGCIVVLSKAFEDCEKFSPAWRPEQSNPMKGIKKSNGRPRDRVLSQDEIRRLLVAVEEMRQSNRLSTPRAVLIRLLLLTGLRFSEWAGAEWSQVDFDFRLLKLPQTKTGARIVSLSDDVIEILRELKKTAKGRWIVPGDKFPNKPCFNLSWQWKEILDRAAITNFRIHDLRHTAASYAHASGLPGRMIQEMLGHANISTTSRYLNLTTEMRKQGANQASRAILDITGPLM